VSGLDPSQVLLHTLVKPEHPVVDYVTHIHGIREEDLVDAPSFDVVQAAILKLVSESTILVGQSLHGDLHAMRLNHSRVIDTALMFTLKQHAGYEGPARTPALRDLAKFCLAKNIHEGDSAHDSRIDAQVAMEICMYELQYGPTKLGTIPRATYGGGAELDKAEIALRHRQLRVHRVSTEISQDMIQTVFTQQAMVVPQEVKIVTSGKSSAYGATTVVFKTKKHADLAFECLSVGFFGFFLFLSQNPLLLSGFSEC
jgi:RNA exonuclease 1